MPSSTGKKGGGWKVEGDPTEGALYPFGTKLGLERHAEQAAHPRIERSRRAAAIGSASRHHKVKRLIQDEVEHIRLKSLRSSV